MIQYVRLDSPHAADSRNDVHLVHLHSERCDGCAMLAIPVRLSDVSLCDWAMRRSDFSVTLFSLPLLQY